MEAEDPRTTEARIRAMSRRATSCGTCDWIASLPPEGQALWDSIMAIPRNEATHQAIFDEIVELGYPKGYKTVEMHRNRGHRAPD